MQSFDFCPYLPDYDNDVCEEVCESNDLSSWMISAPAADSGATPVLDGATPTVEDPADRELYERLAYDQPGGTAPHDKADDLDLAKATLKQPLHKMIISAASRLAAFYRGDQ